MEQKYSTIPLRPIRGSKACRKCGTIVMPKISKRGQQEEFLGRCFDAGDAGESFRCSDCVGFMASRYSFYIFPDLTEEEYCAKLKYDIEIMNRLLTPLQGEDDPLGLPITATGGES